MIVLKGNRIAIQECLHADNYLDEVTRIPPGNGEDASACLLVHIMERDQSRRVQLGKLPKIAACPSCHTRHLHVLGRWCHKWRDIISSLSDYYSKVPFVFVIPGPVTSRGKMNKSLFAEQGVSHVRRHQQ